eukprot:UN30789
MRKWADQIGFTLELEPNILVDWLNLNRNTLAQSYRTAIKNEQDHDPEMWNRLHASYIKDSPMDIYRERRNVWKDDPTIGDFTLFKTADRIKLIIDKMEAPQSEGGAGMDLENLSSSEVPEHPLETYFSLHYKPEADAIHQSIRSNNPLNVLNLPIEDIRHYYGEYVGIYFGFLEFYSNSLVAPTILGIVVFIWQIYVGDINHPVSAVMAVGMILWAKIFVSFWIKQQHIYSCYWGQSFLEKSERTRPEFKGDWVYSDVDGSLIPFEDEKITRKKLLFIKVDRRSMFVCSVC